MSNKGLELWKKALEVIPGGNGLLSKRPERYAPDLWPTYYSRAKGVSVWDLDEKHYVDMAQMGIGTALLGYANERVDNAVMQAIKKGINTTLNCPEEVGLAEKLIALNPFAGSARFARTGGEAMAMAVRIARAHTGKVRILFSGYHGWSDWYLATNLMDSNNLNDHLLPGLEPRGVPRGLQGTVVPFYYNDPNDLYKVAASLDDVAAIVIEGARYDLPSETFLQAVQNIVKEKSAVLIIDEITSGWRMTDGGVYKCTTSKPDIVVYGKAMGNGYAISAIVGKKEVMDAAQETFISSTFWTERIGFVAALESIQCMIECQVWKHLNHIGSMIDTSWGESAKKYDLDIAVTEFKPLVTFKFNYGELNVALQTLFAQEMLKRGYLAAPSVYVSLAHTEQVIEEYRKVIDVVFSLLSQAIREKKVFDLLETRVQSTAFQRLTR